MIKELARLGIIVEAEAAKLLRSLDKTKIIDRINRLEPKPLVVNKNLIEKLLNENRIKLIKKVEQAQSMSISDFVAAYNERYSALQKILLKNPKLANVVSISAAKGECSVIGLVKKEKNVEVEDPTGRLLVSGGNFLNGDVVGLLGRVKDGVMHVRDVVFPDVQLKEACGEGRIRIGPGLEMEIKDDAWYDVGGCILVTSKADLSVVEKELKISEPQAALELLKRRRLLSGPRDFLEPQPDFLIFNSKKSFAQRYRGVLVIGIGKNDKAEIKLKEKTVEFF